MKRRSTHAVAWVLLVVCAVVLWPQRWGGAMTYVVTSGTSMAPTWQAGDLAVLRSAEDYRVGDVVAYRSSELKKIVMHRVVEDRAGVLRLQGDNNDFVDPDEVSEDEALGRLVLRVPAVGKLLSWLAQPVNLLLVLGGLYLLVADRRERRGEAAPAPQQPGPPLFVHVDRVELPASAVVADVACSAELRQLAVRYDRPVLRDRTARTLYVTDGQVVYRCATASRARPLVPAPRGEAAPVVTRLFS